VPTDRGLARGRGQGCGLKGVASAEDGTGRTGPTGGAIRRDQRAEPVGRACGVGRRETVREGGASGRASSCLQMASTRISITVKAPVRPMPPRRRTRCTVGEFLRSILGLPCNSPPWAQRQARAALGTAHLIQEAEDHKGSAGTQWSGQLKYRSASPRAALLLGRKGSSGEPEPQPVGSAPKWSYSQGQSVVLGSPWEGHRNELREVTRWRDRPGPSRRGREGRRDLVGGMAETPQVPSVVREGRA
jgi:hypothetical protein